MHKYLKSVGFSGLDDKSELDKLLADVREHYGRKKVVEMEIIICLPRFPKNSGMTAESPSAGNTMRVIISRWNTIFRTLPALRLLHMKKWW